MASKKRKSKYDRLEPVSTVTRHPIVFFQSATDSAIKSGEWPVIGTEPFPDEESAWGPPKASGVLPGIKVDPRTLQIRYKGVSRRATLKEAAGLDIGTFSQRPDLFVNIVVDRLINGQHDKYRVKS
jgi:hypothetical protein